MKGQIAGIGAAIAALVIMLAWRSWRTFRPFRPSLDRPLIFFAIVFAAITFLRLPQILWPWEINVDESQLLAQGLRYLSHPVPWRDVDGTTSGPLNSWLLSAAMLAGAPDSWATPRAILLLVQFVTMIFIYLALRCFCTRGEAQLALMPTVLFYGLQLNVDFTHYSSEALPVLLICTMAWLLCRARVTANFSAISLFVFGLLAGCVPFAKLQATPMAAFLVAAGLAQLIFAQRKSWISKACVMTAGVLLFPALLLGVVAACGAWKDFWISYVLEPRVYASEGLGSKLEAIWGIFRTTKDFVSYAVSAVATVILLAAAWCYARTPRPGQRLVWMLIAFLVLGAVSAFCMLEAGKGYGHYLLLLIPAQSLFFGLALALGRKLLLAPEENDPLIFPRPIHWFKAAFVAIVCLQLIKAPGYFNNLHSILANWPAGRKSFVARRILKASRAGDTLSVWGWMPSYFVETGLPPATRDAIGHYIIAEGPYREYFRQRYLKDLERSRPAIFVDAMSLGVFTWDWQTLTPHESFAALNKFIEDNYRLWLTVYIVTEKGTGAPVRIYLSKQRMDELDLSPQEINIPLDPSQAPE